MQHPGPKFTEWRRENRMSQRAAAKELGVSQAHISFFESGERFGGRTFLANVFNLTHGAISAEQLLGVQAESFAADPSGGHSDQMSTGSVPRGFSHAPDRGTSGPA